MLRLPAKWPWAVELAVAYRRIGLLRSLVHIGAAVADGPRIRVPFDAPANPNQRPRSSAVITEWPAGHPVDASIAVLPAAGRANVTDPAPTDFS